MMSALYMTSTLKLDLLVVAHWNNIIAISALNNNHSLTYSLPLFHVLCMSVDCIVADNNPLLDFISIKNLNLNLPLSHSQQILFCFLLNIACLEEEQQLPIA
jgi:hypothetical protein